METTYREITHRGITFTQWVRLVVDEAGTMSTLVYQYGKTLESPEAGEGSSLHSSWHDWNSLECPCGGDLKTFGNSTGAGRVVQVHGPWVGQQCPPERIAELRAELEIRDRSDRDLFERGDLIPHPDNPPY